jgi:hypothetical protein
VSDPVEQEKKVSDRVYELSVVVYALNVREAGKVANCVGTYSAAYVRLCMSRSSTSLGFWTRNALWPEGIRWRVFLLLP